MYEDVKAQLHGRPRKKIANNTYLELDVMDSDKINMYLHGNRIASFTKNHITLSHAGWYTRTTKDRLNLALELANMLNVIYQHKWQWYISGIYKQHEQKFYGGIQLRYDRTIRG